MLDFLMSILWFLVDNFKDILQVIAIFFLVNYFVKMREDIKMLKSRL